MKRLLLFVFSFVVASAVARACLAEELPLDWTVSTDHKTGWRVWRAELPGGGEILWAFVSPGRSAGVVTLGSGAKCGAGGANGFSLRCSDSRFEIRAWAPADGSVLVEKHPPA